MGVLSDPIHGASPLSSPRLRARGMTLLFAAASAVGFFAACFPAEYARPPHIAGHSTLFLIPTLTLIAAVVTHVTAERWPGWLWLAIAAATNVMVGMAIYNTGTVPSGAEVFLMWTLVFAAVFLPTRDTVLLGIEAAIVLAAVIAIGPATVKPVTLWVMLMGSFVGITAVVSILKHHLESALRQIHADAVTDPLTGLGNRRRLMDDLDRLLQRNAHEHAGIAMYDLDGFKAFNDAFGHPAGDALLARLGPRLEAAVDGAGVAYRLGGDEFCVVFPSGAAELGLLVERARQALSESGTGYDVGASCGHLALTDENDLVATLREVDARLYEDKRRRAAARLASAGSAAREASAR